MLISCCNLVTSLFWTCCRRKVLKARRSPGISTWFSSARCRSRRHRRERGLGRLSLPACRPFFAAHGLLPKHKDARAVFIIWNQGIRWDRTFPGGLIGLLAESLKTFTDSNPTWRTTPQLLKILPRLDATRDWGPLEVLALLDEVTVIQASPIQTLLENEIQSTIR